VTKVQLKATKALRYSLLITQYKRSAKCQFFDWAIYS